jgi:hypothetical protein
VVWVARGCEDILDEDNPHLDLQGYFPCPKPAYGTCQRGSLVPVPDVLQYKDQLDEVNMLTGRIHALSDALEVKGFYPAGATEISDAVQTAININAGARADRLELGRVWRQQRSSSGCRSRRSPVHHRVGGAAAVIDDLPDHGPLRHLRGARCRNIRRTVAKDTVRFQNTRQTVRADPRRAGSRVHHLRNHRRQFRPQTIIELSRRPQQPRCRPRAAQALRRQMPLTCKIMQAAQSPQRPAINSGRPTPPSEIARRTPGAK